ncbi:MAG: 8-oxo-dGTP diphosphatase [Candidatus Paceibacterota bacterium]|jgi:8-oxo-dGTP diphosphatase
MRKVTLIFLRRGNEILLAMKKRRFGAGKWNGVGGKCEGEETLTQAAVREAREEIGVGLQEKDLELVGDIKFYFPNKEDWNQEVFVYVARKWAGEIVESEEMKPEWFNIENIPYESMWADDPLWLPQVLVGKKIQGDVYFGIEGEGNTVEKIEVREMGKL